MVALYYGLALLESVRVELETVGRHEVAIATPGVLDNLVVRGLRSFLAEASIGVGFVVVCYR